MGFRSMSTQTSAATTSRAPAARSAYPAYATPAASYGSFDGHGAPPSPTEGESSFVDARLAAVAIAVLAFLASFTSLRNGFAYDDVAIVVDNARVHTLSHWWLYFHQAYWPPPVSGGLFRPLVILLYALLWKVGGGAAWPFHAASVALYVATALAVYRLMRLLLPAIGAWVAAALFAVHPVHVECVGNIVGVSEVLAGLGMTLAVCSYIAARRRDADVISTRTTAAICGLYVLATLSKEHGLFLPALLAIAELAAVDDPRPWRARLRTLVPLASALVVLALAYLVARGSIDDVVRGQHFTATLGNYPWTVRLFTFLQVVPEWVRLLFWPARLSIDYSPQETLIPLMWTWTQLPGLLIVLLILPVAVAAWWRSRTTAFALAWLGVTLAIPSGLLVATGYLLAERTFFTPSVGAMLLVGVAVEWVLGRARAHSRAHPVPARATRLGLSVAVLALLVAGTVFSARRQLVWKDNATAFAQGVKDAPLSYRTHYALGGYLFKHGKFAAGERELRAAIRLFPVDPEPMEYLASQYVANRIWQPAIPLLRAAVANRERSPQATTGMRRFARTMLANVYIETAQYDSAAVLMRRAVATDPADSAAVRLLRVAQDRAAGRTPAPTPR